MMWSHSAIGNKAWICALTALGCLRRAGRAPRYWHTSHLHWSLAFRSAAGLCQGGALWPDAPGLTLVAQKVVVQEDAALLVQDLQLWSENWVFGVSRAASGVAQGNTMQHWGRLGAVRRGAARLPRIPQDGADPRRPSFGRLRLCWWVQAGLTSMRGERAGSHSGSCRHEALLPVAAAIPLVAVGSAQWAIEHCDPQKRSVKRLKCSRAEK